MIFFFKECLCDSLCVRGGGCLKILFFILFLFFKSSSVYVCEACVRQCFLIVPY
jgi:hypothetical protein